MIRMINPHINSFKRCSKHCCQLLVKKTRCQTVYNALYTCSGDSSIAFQPLIKFDSATKSESDSRRQPPPRQPKYVVHTISGRGASSQHRLPSKSEREGWARGI
ncbi:hypothetical protein J6590_048574 [Homalodisca vitripennis]|nr:hypothetical protein J6590_048574 [Homalodisca vitripennis]